MNYKENIFFKICVCLMLLVFIGQPVLAQVQTSSDNTNDYFEGRVDGEVAVRVSGAWFFAGFCGGGLGVLAAFLIKPSPSTALLTGKSQLYIQGYLEGYKDKGASLQGKKALTGLGVSCALYVTFYVVLFVIVGIAAESESDY